MIEPYQYLLAHAERYGYNPAHVGPASVDLCLADTIRGYSPGRTHTWEYQIGTTIVFHPGTFYLCSTVEYITVPTTHAAQIMMRSSLARQGLGHRMAGYIDPGFEGQITLELETTLPVHVTIGARIVQLIYHRLTEATVRPYQGHYQGQRGPTEAYQSGERPHTEES